MLKGNHNPISEPEHFVLEEEVAKWMKGVGGLNRGWVGKEGANVRDGARGFNDICGCRDTAAH